MDNLTISDKKTYKHCKNECIIECKRGKRGKQGIEGPRGLQ